MQQILFFLIRNKNFLLFALLFFVSLVLTIESHSYHKSKAVTSANFLSGGIYSFKSGITGYFDLKEQNNLLLEENARLRFKLKNTALFSAKNSRDTIAIDSNFNFITATIINNNYSKTKNNLTLNKGRLDSIEIDMGVLSPQGVIGIINSVSKNYATVQSLLNTNSQIVAKFKKSDHFGTLVWDTQNPGLVQLTEIPRIAPVALGDTIVTDGKSSIFPEGILIGQVHSFDREEGDDYYSINVQLFTDMTSVKHAYVISHRDALEIKKLENLLENAEQ